GRDADPTEKDDGGLADAPSSRSDEAEDQPGPLGQETPLTEKWRALIGKLRYGRDE
ncbi:MAG: hypothetical protein GY851_36575, partial [bacterium]|nr:hypothetical protein [bacterium]